MTPTYMLVCAYFVALLVVLASIPAAIVWAALKIEERLSRQSARLSGIAEHLYANEGVDL